MVWRRSSAGILAACFASVAGAAIFDRDDRIASTDPRSPVGIVTSSRTSYGSGFLIDDCHVLTARHVIGKNEVMGMRSRFRLSVGVDRQSDGTVIAAGRQAERRGDFSDDWALLRLDSCLGKEAGAYPVSNQGFYRIGTSSALLPTLVGLGYPSDRKRRQATVDPACAARQRTEIGLRHDCAAIPGGSGGPLIAWNAARSRFEAVAINVAEFRQRSAVAFTLERANLAVELAPLRLRIEAAMRQRSIASR